MVRWIRKILQNIYHVDAVVQGGKVFHGSKVIGECKNGIVTFYKPLSKNWLMKLFKAERVVCITYFKDEIYII